MSCLCTSCCFIGVLAQKYPSLIYCVALALLTKAMLSCRNSSRVSLKLRLAITGVASLQSCIYSWRMQRGGGRVPLEQGKAGPVQPWEQPEPCSPQDVLECHRDSTSRHHFFPSESVPELLVTHSKFSHQAVLCCQQPLDQEGVAGSELPVWVALLLY